MMHIFSHRWSGWSWSQSLFWERFCSCYLKGGPSWGGSAVRGSVCPLSWRCYQFCFTWNPKWLQSDYREDGLEQRQIQNEGEMPRFSPAFGGWQSPHMVKCLLASVKSWVQTREGVGKGGRNDPNIKKKFIFCFCGPGIQPRAFTW
jgi:hypothetical protein